MNCPICNSKLDKFSYSDDIQGAYITVESGVNCTVCDYHNFYSYGMNHIEFGPYSWQWYYNTDEQIIDGYEMEIKLALVDRQGRPSFKHRHYQQFEYKDGIPF